MALWTRHVAFISVVLMLLTAIVVAIVLWPRAEVAPVLTVEFLGYTNRNRNAWRAWRYIACEGERGRVD